LAGPPQSPDSRDQLFSAASSLSTKVSPIQEGSEAIFFKNAGKKKDLSKKMDDHPASVCEADFWLNG
jgi:hypothetical protein